MKRTRILQGLAGLLTLAASAAGQTTTGFAPSNFGNFILTSLPSNATGDSGISTVYTSSGSQFTFGTGGALVNPANFNYTVTGPNTATVTLPATANAPAATTNLVFTGESSGTYTTVRGSDTTTGRFSLAEIPSSAPIQNVSARTTLTTNGATTVGFVIAGTMPRRVLVRAIGPGLAAFGVTTAVSNPALSLYRGNQLIAQNDDWGSLQALTSTGSTTGGTATGGTTTGGTTTGGTTTGGTTTGGTTTGGTTTTTGTTFTGTFATGGAFSTQMAAARDFASAGAFALTTGSRDAGFVVTLPPGAYTVVVTNSTAVSSSAGGTTTGGTTTGGTTTGGTTTGGTTTGDTTTGGTTTGGTTTGGTTTGGTTTGGETTGGTTTGGTTTGGTTTGGTTTGTGTTATAAVTTGDVLVEVYFIE